MGKRDEWKSPTLEEARRQGRLEARRFALSTVLRSRFGVEPPSELLSIVESTTDEYLLSAWFDFSFQVENLDAMLARACADRFGPPGF